jgi:Putative addiction module component
MVRRLDVDALALKLEPDERAHLAETLLLSLETITEQENTRLWIEEAKRRDAELDEHPSKGRPSIDVFRDAASRIG